MMIERFTVEETNLMCIFDTSSRDALIADMTAALPIFNEPEMAELAENVLDKLSGMSDAEFVALELYPEYWDHDEQED